MKVLGSMSQTEIQLTYILPDFKSKYYRNVQEKY